MPKPIVYPRKVLLQLDDDLYKAAEDYRFKHRIPTMSEAFRQLIFAGLKAEDAKAITDALRPKKIG